MCFKSFVKTIETYTHYPGFDRIVYISVGHRGYVASAWIGLER